MQRRLVGVSGGGGGGNRHRQGFSTVVARAAIRGTGGRDRACELVRGGRVGSQWQRTGRPGRHGNSGGGEQRRQQHRRLPPPSCTHAAAAHRSPVGSTNLTRWPAGQFTPIWDRGRQVSERSKIRNDRRRRSCVSSSRDRRLIFFARGICNYYYIFLFYFYLFIFN